MHNFQRSALSHKKAHLKPTLESWSINAKIVATLSHKKEHLKPAHESWSINAKIVNSFKVFPLELTILTVVSILS